MLGQGVVDPDVRVEGLALRGEGKATGGGQPGGGDVGRLDGNRVQRRAPLIGPIRRSVRAWAIRPRWLSGVGINVTDQVYAWSRDITVRVDSLSIVSVMSNS